MWLGSIFAFVTILLVIYSLILLWAFDTYQRISIKSLQSLENISQGVSIVISVRNEAQYIHACLSSILTCTYPHNLVEIIVVNDHSDDNTCSIIHDLQDPRIKLVNSVEDGKKAALATGISQAKYEIILCTDGDTVVGVSWIKSHVEAQANYDFVTGIIRYDQESTLLDSLQGNDNAATMILTGAGIKSKRFWVANGANMSFKKSLFKSADGYTKNQEIASGDDVFLIHAAKEKDPEKVFFLTDLDSSVLTKSESHWEDFWMQRRRWAGKTSAVGDRYLIFIQSIPFLLAISIILIFFAALMTLNKIAIIFVTSIFIVKMIIDDRFLRAARLRLGYDPMITSNFLYLSLIYLGYILYVGSMALFPKSYEWKNRTLNR